MQASSTRQSSNLALHAATVGIVVLMDYSFGSPGNTLALGGILMAIAYLYIAYSEMRHDVLWFNPLSYYFLWYSVGLGISPLWIAFAFPEQSLPLSVVRVPFDDLARGYVVFLIGSVSLHAGLHVNRPRKTRMKQEKYDLPMTMSSIVLLYCIGVACLVFPVLQKLGTIYSALHGASLGALSVLLFSSSLELKVSKRIFVTTAVVGTVILFLLSLRTQSKFIVILSLFPVVWTCLARSQSRKWAPLIGSLIVIVYVFTIVPTVQHLRKASAAGESVDVLSSFQHLTLSIPVVTQDRSNETIFHGFLIRQFDPAPVGFFVGEVKRSGFQHGATMLDVFHVFIPRILWPNKPTVTRGKWFTAYLGFSKTEDTATTSTGMSATGELYWNFGFTGVVAGMFGLGWLIGGLWSIAGNDPRQLPLHMTLYAYVMTNMPNMPEAVTVLVGFVAIWLIYSVAFVIVGRTLNTSTVNRHSEWIA